MKRKSIVLAIILTACSVAEACAFSAAVGGEFAMSGIGNGLPGSSVFVSLRVPKSPLVFGIGGAFVTGGGASLALMGDYWLAKGNLVNFVNYYVGPGAFLSLSSAGIYSGLRIPIGLNAFPLKPLEIFVECAPSFDIVTPSALYFGWAGFQTGFGFRFWF
jgi:hypothetical protein